MAEVLPACWQNGARSRFYSSFAVVLSFAPGDGGIGALLKLAEELRGGAGRGAVHQVEDYNCQYTTSELLGHPKRVYNAQAVS